MTSHSAFYRDGARGRSDPRRSPERLHPRRTGVKQTSRCPTSGDRKCAPGGFAKRCSRSTLRPPERGPIIIVDLLAQVPWRADVFLTEPCWRRMREPFARQYLPTHSQSLPKPSRRGLRPSTPSKPAYRNPNARSNRRGCASKKLSRRFAASRPRPDHYPVSLLSVAGPTPE